LGETLFELKRGEAVANLPYRLRRAFGVGDAALDDRIGLFARDGAAGLELKRQPPQKL